MPHIWTTNARPSRPREGGRTLPQHEVVSSGGYCRGMSWRRSVEAVEQAMMRLPPLSTSSSNHLSTSASRSFGPGKNAYSVVCVPLRSTSTPHVASWRARARRPHETSNALSLSWLVSSVNPPDSAHQREGEPAIGHCRPRRPGTGGDGECVLTILSPSDRHASCANLTVDISGVKRVSDRSQDSSRAFSHFQQCQARLGAEL